MEQPSRRVSAVVLAGGHSSRLGEDKRRLRLWGAAGPSLLAHTVALLGVLCADVVVVLNDPQAWPELPARLIGDRIPDGGPLGGIYTGLEAAAHEHVLVVACDMPLLSRPLLAAMLAWPHDYDALVPRAPCPTMARNQYGAEPLHAIYTKGCLEPIRRTLATGRRQVAAFFPLVRVVYLEAEIIGHYDPAGHSFLNVNTSEQLRTVRHILTAGRE